MIYKPNRTVDKFFIHYTSSDIHCNNDELINIIRKWHIERGFNDIGYHFVINKDGSILTGRRLEVTPAAQKGHNTGSIAIALHYKDAYTQPQENSLIALTGVFNQLYNGQLKFLGHKDVANTLCPGSIPYKELLNLDNEGFINNAC